MLHRQSRRHQWVSTHSRLKAAGGKRGHARCKPNVSTHSRLKAAGFHSVFLSIRVNVSTHSRLKAAGDSVFLDLY